ncbi:MAG: cation diffusion facilitator family transporter [gamma proteobacterium symbiont of Bathyaustriella thionipta]|nr:cation diffusion facilitator family transporter [gamma proteobacterium symbiont of Bathyaustriella thionipta]
MNKQQRAKITRRVTLVGAAVNLLLSIVKIIVGVMASAQSLVADGIHSLSDLLSDGLVLYAANKAQAEADEEHPYGHGRFETIATLALGGLLMLVAVGIIWNAVERFLSDTPLLIPNVIALWIALLSVLSKEALYWYTLRAAYQCHSKLLEANAWHHRSDAISSIVVLAGLGLAQAGMPWLDGAAAMIVALMIAWVGGKLIFSSANELADAGLDAERLSRVQETAKKVSGVNALHMLRTRYVGHEALADVHVQVGSNISVSEGHSIAEAVRQALVDNIDEIADVTVHIDPEDDEHDAPCKDLPLRDEINAKLQQHWAEWPALLNAELVLHYQNGLINLDVLLNSDTHVSPSDLARAQEALKAMTCIGSARFFSQQTASE